MKKIIAVIIVLIFSLALYGLTLRGEKGNLSDKQIRQEAKTLESSNERSRFALTKSLVEKQTFAIPSDLANALKPDVAVYKGRYYIYFPPGISLMAVPFYLLGREFGMTQLFTFSLPALFALSNILLLYLISRRVFKLPIWASLLAGFVYAFSSISWAYAVTLLQHQVTTFLILSSFLAIFAYRSSKKFGIGTGIYVGLAYGWSLWVDYPNPILMSPIVIYFLLSSLNFSIDRLVFKFSLKLEVLLLALAFLALVGVHGYYNLVNFGSPTRLSGSLVGYSTLQEQSLNEKTGKLSKVALKIVNKDPVKFFKEQSLPNGLYTLLVSDDRGLMLYCPIFILAILGMFSLRKRWTFDYSILVSLVSVFIFLYSSWGDPWGGWAYGPRYLIPVMALLSPFVVVWISQARFNIVRRVIFALLFAFSSAVALLGALTSNLVPPKVEGVYLHLKYNFLRNVDFLVQGKTNSYAFNQFFAGKLSLMQYYFVIYALVMIFTLFILFILPKLKKYGN